MFFVFFRFFFFVVVVVDFVNVVVVVVVVGIVIVGFGTVGCVLFFLNFRSVCSWYRCCCLDSRYGVVLVGRWLCGPMANFLLLRLLLLLVLLLLLWLLPKFCSFWISDTKT